MMLRREKKISVLMSVYNTPEEYLRAAIESILNQSFRNFEFVIIDDCSDEETKNILKSYVDPRIRLYRNRENMGLTKSLNIGLELCKGDYIARMDSDDIAFPERLELQLKYIEAKNFAVIGSEYEYYPKRRYQRFVTDNLEKQQIRMLFSNAGIIHSTAFLDKGKMDSLGIRYDEVYKKSQDYSLWCNYVSKGFVLGTCPHVLLKWRESPGQISKTNSSEQKECRNRIRKRYISEMLNICDDDCDYLIANFDGLIDCQKTDIRKMSKCLCKIIHDNKEEYKLIEKEFCFIWVIQLINILRTHKSMDLLFNEMSVRLFKPSNIIYLIGVIHKERKVYSI